MGCLSYSFYVQIRLLFTNRGGGALTQALLGSGLPAHPGTTPPGFDEGAVVRPLQKLGGGGPGAPPPQQGAQRPKKIFGLFSFIFGLTHPKFHIDHRLGGVPPSKS